MTLIYAIFQTLSNHPEGLILEVNTQQGRIFNIYSDFVMHHACHWMFK